ncbi:MAG: cytochrome c biogenesis protein CcdA [Candidatus Anstonellaceae archaeon]
MGLELFFAFLIGAISFLSPCIIPMIMVYLTTITGFSFEALSSSGKNPMVRKVLVKKTLVFVLSFTLVFTLIGGLAAGFAASMGQYFDALSLAAGALFVLLGLHYLGALKVIFWRFGGMMDDEKLKKMAGRWRERDGTLSYAGVFVVGLVFALVCSHCISPTLFPTLLLASSAEDFLGGSVVMLSFSLGLGAAFMIAALFLSQTIEKLKWIARHRRAVHAAIGLFFLGFGLLLLSGNYLSFVSLLYRIIPWKVPGM